MKIYFFTNLDEAKPYVPQYVTGRFDHVPQIGSIIQIPLPIEPKGSCFELAVTSVTYDMNEIGVSVRVELHMPPWERRSIREWSDHFRRRLRDAT